MMSRDAFATVRIAQTVPRSGWRHAPPHAHLPRVVAPAPGL